KIDHHRRAQAEADRNFQATNDRLTAQLRNIRRLEHRLRDLNMMIIQNLPYEQMNYDVVQEVTELNKSKTHKFEQDEHELYDDLTERQLAHNS
ncbi:unnamed protein product, partial [Rotaria sordida]